MHETFTAFVGQRCLASGPIADVALAVKRADAWAGSPIMIFSDATGRAVDFDLRGDDREVLARLAMIAPAESDQGAEPPSAPRGRGRPKLGVVAREVTLLPRHWDWLGAQPGGASVVLRRLVDAARHASEARERVRAAQEAAHRFMTALAGNLPNYEETLRALYAGERSRFEAANAPWPEDVRDYARELAESAFA